ncbi:MAG: hypothetical protein O3A00_10595 [Planctomycetota bacterium]|nr:hypothetical protein [Planctomycetota bacterium]
MKPTTIVSCLATLLFLVMPCSGQESKTLPPITSIAKVKPDANVFKRSSRDKPLVIKSKEIAAKYFSADSLATLIKHVDFDRQLVLVFAWRGSGQDRLEYSVLESFPEQVVFSFKPGRTRDLRPHTEVFAVRSNVKWRSGDATKPVKSDQYIKVEVKGILSNEVLAIGGETTGQTITSRGVRWELDLAKNAALQKTAAQLHGKVVVVTGQLHVKRGVEIRQRWIVAVESLRDGGSEGSP